MKRERNKILKKRYFSFFKQKMLKDVSKGDGKGQEEKGFVCE